MAVERTTETQRRPTRIILSITPALIASAAAIAAAFTLPLSSDTESVIRVERAKDAVTLEPGTTLRQTFPSPKGVLSGIVLYADADRLAGRAVHVRVSDATGRVQAEGSAVRTSYERGLLRLAFPLKWFQVPRDEELTAEVALVRGPSLALRAATNDVFPWGVLTDPRTEDDQGDLALAVNRPAPLSDAARRGVLAGVLVLLGTALIQLLPSERQRWWAAVCLVAVATPVALSGFWFSKGPWGISDWDYYFSLHETYRRSILEYRAFPFWNAATCGGTAGLGDPEFPVFTVTFLLELLFGIPTGLRLAIYASTIIGGTGMLLLARRLGLSPAGAVVAALGAFFGTVNLLEVVEGHVNVFSAMWVPWIFWAWLGAYRGGIGHRPWAMGQRFWALICGLFLALTFFQGGIYMLFYTLLAFALLPFLVSRPFRAVVVTIQAGLWALGLSAVKLLPVLFWLRQFPDETYASSTYTLPWLREILLGRHLHGAVIIPGQDEGWHEYGAYIGPVLLFFAFLGALKFRQRLIRGLLIGAVLALLLSSAGPILKPFFDAVPYIPRSNISRVILFAVLPLALLAGYGLKMLQRKLHTRSVAVIPLLVGAVAIDLMSLVSPLSEQAFVIPSVVPPVSPAPPPIAYTLLKYPIEAAGENHSRAYAATIAGYGTLAYCSVLGPKPLIKTIHDEGDTSVVTTEGDQGSVTLRRWSPNRVEAGVTVPTATKVILNANYARGWVANGAPAENANGRVAIPVGAGTHTVTFEYRPEGFRAGFLVTLGTVLGVLAMLRKGGVGRRICSQR